MLFAIRAWIKVKTFFFLVFKMHALLELTDAFFQVGHLHFRGDV